MAAIKPHYAGLCQYLHRYFGDRWKRVEEGMSQELREYTIDRYVNQRPRLPPIIFFTAEQRILYSGIFPEIQDILYQDLAVEIIGRPTVGISDMVSIRAPTRIGRYSTPQPASVAESMDEFWRGN